MKSKKADMTIEEMIKIIFAVISIGILIYLAASLLGLFHKKTEIEQAQATLDQIVERVDILNGGEVGDEGEYLIQSPTRQGWYMFYFGETFVSRPSSCKSGEACLCICFNDESSRESSCNKLGVCKSVILKLETTCERLLWLKDVNYCLSLKEIVDVNLLKSEDGVHITKKNE